MYSLTVNQNENSGLTPRMTINGFTSLAAVHQDAANAFGARFGAPRRLFPG